MERLNYFVRRLVLIIPTFIGITLVCFGITQCVPGGPVEQMVMQMKGIGSGESRLVAGAVTAITADQRRAMERHFGFDKPLHVRYWHWLVRDRMGMAMQSYKYPDKTAWQIIRQRMPVSLLFGIAGFLTTYLVCIPLGIAKALRHGSRFDFVSSILVFAGYALPTFAFGMVLRMLLCGTVDSLWDVFPLTGWQSDTFAALPLLARIGDIAWHMALPVLCYVIGNFAVLTILTQNALLEQIGRDYMRTVIAKGGTLRRAVWGHALRNAMIPVVTGIGGILTVMFAGSVIIEQVFEIPGMGRLGLESIVGRDYAVFMGILSLTSILGLLGNILSDFCYVLIDPRINFNRR